MRGGILSTSRESRRITTSRSGLLRRRRGFPRVPYGAVRPVCGSSTGGYRRRRMLGSCVPARVWRRLDTPRALRRARLGVVATLGARLAVVCWNANAIRWSVATRRQDTCDLHRLGRCCSLHPGRAARSRVDLPCAALAAFADCGAGGRGYRSRWCGGTGGAETIPRGRPRVDRPGRYWREHCCLLPGWGHRRRRVCVSCASCRGERGSEFVAHQSQRSDKDDPPTDDLVRRARWSRCRNAETLHRARVVSVLATRCALVFVGASVCGYATLSSHVLSLEFASVPAPAMIWLTLFSAFAAWRPRREWLKAFCLGATCALAAVRVPTCLAMEGRAADHRFYNDRYSPEYLSSIMRIAPRCQRGGYLLAPDDVGQPWDRGKPVPALMGAYPLGSYLALIQGCAAPTLLGDQQAVDSSTLGRSVPIRVFEIGRDWDHPTTRMSSYHATCRASSFSSS